MNRFFRFTFVCVVILLIALLIAVTLVSLTGYGEANQDAPQGDRNVGPADVINFPDGFSNVAHKCDGANMVYVIYHKASDGSSQPYGSVAVVKDDPRCAR